jgi:hypothetical protein
LPGGLLLSSSGTVSGRPTTPGTSSFGVTVFDSLGTSASRNLFITIIRLEPLTVITPSLPNGAAGQDYAVNLTASGGSGGYQWLLTSGSLPDGLRLSSSGTISGRPTTPGTSSFGVTVFDKSETSASVSLSITITNPQPPFDVQKTCPVVPFALDQTVDIPIQPSTTATLTYDVISPLWIKIQMVNGVAHAKGMAPAPGGYALSVLMRNLLTAESQRFDCSFEVAQALTGTGFVCPANSLDEGAAVSIPMQASGGYPPYQWSLDGPSWLSLRSATGPANTLTGAAQIGTIHYVITVQDAIQSKPIRLECTFNVVSNELKIQAVGAGCTTDKFLALKNFSMPLSATGGVGGYQWSIVAAPPGFQLSATTGSAVLLLGVLPAEGGQQTITVRVVDKNGTATQFTCVIDVIGALSIEGKKTEYFVGQSFSTTLTIAGGQPPYAYSLKAPDSISLSGNGPALTLSGKPASLDPFTCQVTVTDSAGSVPVTFDCSGTPTYAPLDIHGTCPTNPVTLESNFSITLTASGGNGEYKWSTPVLPQWLSAPALSGTSVTLGGSPDTAGSAPFTVELGDTAGNPTAKFSCTLQVNPPPIPAITITGLDFTGTAVTASVQFDGPTPVPLEGEAQLSFVSNAINLVRVGTTDDTSNPEVTFRDPQATNNATRLRFTVPKGATTVSLGQISTGTVAGTIRLTVASMTAGGADVLESVLPFQELVIPRLAPVLDEVSFETGTGNGFTIVVKGTATPRAADTMSLTFTGRPGVQLRNPTATVTMTNTFRDYFTSAASRVGGGQFSIRVPVTIDGDASQINGVTVRLSNASGDSNTKSANR